MLVLGATLVTYGLTEFVGGYGFLAVFIAAITRGSDEARRRISEFADQLERILLAFVLVGFGALLSAGILTPLDLRGALVGLALVLVVRPLAGMIGLIGNSIPLRERLAISFFGIRGMGSIYYLSWAANEAEFETAQLQTVWAVTAWVILVSIVVHGVTASPVMRKLDSASARPTG